MVRGRRSAKKAASEQRAARDAEAFERLRHENAERTRRAASFVKRAGCERGELTRLSELSRELERLDREALILIEERDALVDSLRAAGSSWNDLASRTRLSRQALMKGATPRHSV